MNQPKLALSKSTQNKDLFLKLQKDPVLFFEKILGIDSLEEYQRTVIRAVQAHERVAISACHDLGKSYLMARIVIWLATCFPRSKILTTAPTYNQVKNILWSEIRAAHSKSKFPLGGKLNLTDWQLSKDGDWFAIGFSPRNEVTGGQGQGTQSSFQGFHAPTIMVVFDEATGIQHGIWNMAEGILTSQDVRFVAIGNPTSRNSEFYNCFRSRAWHKIYLSCFDSPNLIANGVTTMRELENEVRLVESLPDSEAQERMQMYEAPRPYLISLKWVVASIIKWGFKHPLTVSKIFGKFPEEGDDTLITLNDVEDSQRRTYTPVATDRKIIGIDVARFGSDSSVLTAMHGKQVLGKLKLDKHDTNSVVGNAIAFAKETWPDSFADIIVVDVTGIGAGVTDNLTHYVEDTPGLTCEVRAVQFGAGVECDQEAKGNYQCDHKSCDRARFFNQKSRLYGLLGDDMKGETGICLPPDEGIYLEELPTILYGYNSKGQMVVESKDAYKKRTGRGSPDHVDSLGLANYGRYDDLELGKFIGDDFGDSDFAPPFAASMGVDKTW